MNKTMTMAGGLLLAVLAAWLPACNDSTTGGGGAAGDGSAPRLTGDVVIDGSSTVEPITSAVVELFNNVQPDVKAVVGVSGTGGGFKRFVANETDISNASRPIKVNEHRATEEASIEYIEVPVAYDGLSVVVNMSNTWVDNLTVDELKKIFLESGAAMRWSDVRDGWPDDEIKIYAPGTDSGTFDYFKEVMAGDIRPDMSVSEDDNVLVLGVSGERTAIGFFGVAYYLENKDKLKVVPIVNPDTGEAVEPTPESIETGEYAPFSRPLFIYVKRSSADKPQVDAFVEFYLAHPEVVEEVGYVQLPPSIRSVVASRWRGRETGTSFLNDAGEKVRGPLSEVYD